MPTPFLILLVLFGVGSVGAVIPLVVWLRRGRSPRVLALAGLFALLGVWACPWLHLRIDRFAQQRLLDRIDAYRGEPIHVLVSALRLPLPEFEMSLAEAFRDGVSHTATISTAPWYAPFGLYHVRLLVTDDDTLFMAQLDD